MSVLDQARTHLTDLATTADREGRPSSSLLSSLQSVGDMVCRIGGNEASPVTSRHYTAEKSGDLVTAAVRVRREALVLYAASVAGTDVASADVETEVFEISDLVEKVDAALAARMWGCARGEATPHSEAVAARRSAMQLLAWADRLVERSVPDPKEDR